MLRGCRRCVPRFLEGEIALSRRREMKVTKNKGKKGSEKVSKEREKKKGGEWRRGGRRPVPH